MKRSLATNISATWAFPRASVLVNCTNNSANIRDKAFAASNVATARALSSGSMESAFFRVVKLIIRKFWRIAIVGTLVALAGCGGNREIQYDGTGTDEMRKSPCACLPVKYQAPKFKWGTV